MSERNKYIKRATQFVTAVQVDLEMDGFTYRKWAARNDVNAVTGS